MSIRVYPAMEDVDQKSLGLAEIYQQSLQFFKIMEGSANVPNFEKKDICHDFIFGRCSQQAKCMGVHSTMPYQWEVENGRGWSRIPDNEGVERDYCNPAKTQSCRIPPVNFITMTRGHLKVRRLATVSSLDQPDAVFATKWAWYWEEKDGVWTPYLSPTVVEDLEREYMDPSRGSVIEFTAGRFTYEVDLEVMIQINTSSHTQRLVRRRPMFKSSIDVQRATGTSNTTTSSVPSFWDQSRLPGIGFERVMLPNSATEYKDIKALLDKTTVGFNIHTIKRVQNPILWKFYVLQRDQMESSGTSINEKQLFHGTDSKHVDSICRNNFDWRLCGTNGTSFGKGSYFARDAKYSHSYTSQSGLRSMFVCRVLVGDYTEGNSSYVRPPPKETGGSIFYDSCVDNIKDPKVFVVFEKYQVYPEYLIEYSDTASPPNRATQPNPVVQPNPTPQPNPVVQPNRTPQQNPIVQPNPTPQPNPVVQPNRTPQPNPIVQPNPTPQPNPIVQPNSTPQQNPNGSDSDDPEFNRCFLCLVWTLCCPCGIYFYFSQ
ncbi:protein mono-ADP-ribosyltransferase PARP12 isoform X2 [Salmo trutta]|nr:protein mono-ADP-ribosyltransferase PARP12-like isoform X2 [Salmo trutta]